jgi:pterin-4a-carbinolamine dehydratase
MLPYLFFLIFLYNACFNNRVQATETRTSISPYKIIPPCSLCKQKETKILKDDAIEKECDNLIKSINDLDHSDEEEDNQNNNSEDSEGDSEDNNKWHVDKNAGIKRLKINYKNKFDVYFKKILIIKEIAEKWGHTLDIQIKPTLMTLYLYTPSAKGISRRDFKIAYDISKAMSEKKPHSDNPSRKLPKGTRLTLNATDLLLFSTLPAWKLSLSKGRNITRTFTTNSFAHGMDMIYQLSTLSDLEFELKSLYFSQNKLTIIIQRQIGKTVYAETVAFAKTLDQLLLKSGLVLETKSLKRSYTQNNYSSNFIHNIERKCGLSARQLAMYLFSQLY